MDLNEELKIRLKRVNKIFNIQSILSLKSTNEYVQKYYLINKIPYSIFHTKSDLMYMGISRDEKYKKSDLLEHARTVQKYIDKNTRSVLELATGRGASSFYLARLNPRVRFYGIDISPGQLHFAYKKAKKVGNYHPGYGDYHDLKKFKDGELDIVFVIEALCYSENKEVVLKEIYRVLKKGGILIVFDGYYKKADTLEKDQIIAQKLVAKGMALNTFEDYSDFIKKARNVKFEIESEEDFSKFVIPTMKRFEYLAKKFFKYSKLAKLAVKMFPKEFTYNVISGYLISLLIQLNLASYKLTILRKATSRNFSSAVQTPRQPYGTQAHQNQDSRLQRSKALRTKTGKA